MRMLERMQERAEKAEARLAKLEASIKAGSMGVEINVDVDETRMRELCEALLIPFSAHVRWQCPVGFHLVY